MDMIILLENIRSALNVGSMLRTADACGVQRVLYVGYTPCPIDRMGRRNEKIHKTALGAEQTIPWQQYTTVNEALAQHSKHTPVIVEQTKQAVPYTDLQLQNPLIIFGNEVEGVTETTRNMVAHHIFLPMRGKKESLNVAACAAVVLFHYTYETTL